MRSAVLIYLQLQHHVDLCPVSGFVPPYPASSTASSNSSESAPMAANGDPKKGALVGAVSGVSAVLFLLVLALFLRQRRSRRRGMAFEVRNGKKVENGTLFKSVDTRTRTTEGSATRVPLALARYNAPGIFALTLAHIRAYQMLLKDGKTRAHLLHDVPIQDVDGGNGNNHAERVSGRDEAATMATIGSGRSSNQLPSRQPSERVLLTDCDGDRAGSLEELHARRIQITAEMARLDTEITRLQVESSRSAPPTYITNEGQIGTVSMPAREAPADVKQDSFKFKLRAWLYRA
jgi:hypothetical protein